MVLIGLGSSSLFVIIIFNFISIPKIWSDSGRSTDRRRRRHARRRHAGHSLDRHRSSAGSGGVFTTGGEPMAKQTQPAASNFDCTLKFASLGESVA